MQRVARCAALPGRNRYASCPEPLLASKSVERVLLIDERERSTGLAAAVTRHSSQAFARMLHAARAAHPDAEFWIAPSGDAGSGKWLSSSVSSSALNMSRLYDAGELCAALPYVDRVYTLGASEGLHALINGLPVHVYGTPWYAGWGLTHDDIPMPERTSRPSLAALFNVVFLHFAQYLNPVTHARGTLADVLDCIELQHAIQQRFADLCEVVGVRFQWWKRPFATPYISAGGGTLRWTQAPETLDTNDCAVLWGARSAAEIAPDIARVRIEDGFFHSHGLGSDMIAPRSQVIDRRGLYFDASQPSDLSVLLNETEFTHAELQRAAALRATVVELGVTDSPPE
jgi:capsular polysaccharide export protein